jgi:dihydroflavonol-4-reductase
MHVLVTGATGFIGGHVVAELLRRGHHVRALVRAATDPGDLPTLGAEVVRGDVLDRAAVQQAMTGCDGLVHLAADFRLWVPDEQAMARTNVEGTHHVLEAARAAGVTRVVYTSTVAVLDATPDDPEPRLADARLMRGAYERTKWQAEHEARRLEREGLGLCIVYPTWPVGPGDHRPTPAGQLIVDFVRGRLPFYVELRLNAVPVEDVALGHALALEGGRPGAGYVLGGYNVTLGELLAKLARLTGRSAPRARVPVALVHLAALVDEGVVSRLTGHPPRVSRASAAMARRRLWVDSGKAVRELGWPQTSLDAALERAVSWFGAHGYY